ncbi:glycoside hydrolase family 43 protein [Brachybacterium sp. DNPG3]
MSTPIPSPAPDSASDGASRPAHPAGLSRRGILAATTALATIGGAAALAPSAAAAPSGKGGSNGKGNGKGNSGNNGGRSRDRATKALADLPVPTFAEVSVHDPSVIVTGGTTYVFGSHLAAARTEDRLAWTSVADLVTPENPLFDDVTEELAEAFAWANTDTLWAPDVAETPDGRFRMYYCACEGSSPRSALGSAIADEVEGPYVDEGIFLRSGMWGEASPDGAIYDPLVHPNAVDPQHLVDADGRHRLVYGSYSGGIFLLELDPDTGQPLPDQGYGIHLIGGNHSRIEAPYIIRSEETGYYYLLVTFGGLDAAGGYNVRVGRATDIEGPYLDPMGQDLRDCRSDASLPLFDDATIEPYAAKLMGNHRFTQEVSSDASSSTGSTGSSTTDEGTTTLVGQGYVSPGHVSAWTDPADDQPYLFFHTRFPDTGEFHQVRVHRLRTTSTGWLVVAPHRYGGESARSFASGRARCLRSDTLAGSWQLVDHGRAISADVVASTPIRLEDDGTITGSVTGTWALEGSDRAVIEIDGVRFDGVFDLGWHEGWDAWTTTFSVLGPDGRTLWGSREI